MASPTLTPKARPELTTLDTAPNNAPQQEDATDTRPQFRPDALYKSIIFAQLGNLANATIKPTLVVTATETLRPIKRPLSVTKQATKKSAHKVDDSLSKNDRHRYNRIFEHQQSGHWPEADALIAKLDNTKLMGHVMHQRYMHPTKYQSRFDELSYWLDNYADHPNANDVYRLANIRKPQDTNINLVRPKKARKMHGSLEYLLTDVAKSAPYKKRSKQQNRLVRTLKKSVGRHLSKGQPTQALSTLNNSSAAPYMSAAERDSLLARISASYLYEGKPQDALIHAQAALEGSHDAVPLAGWIAGLSTWMKGDYIAAANYFANTSSSKYANGWLKSASAYWAARSYKELRNSTNHKKWLINAAQHPRTFYGLIATRALGQSALTSFNWQTPKFTAAHKTILTKIPSTNRAISLVESGQHHLAELEFRQVYPGANPALQEAMLAYALNNGLASFALRFGNTYKTEGGKLYDAALYPVGGWEPKNGYQMDKALIHAFIRQESEFNPTAENPSGATGLMQLMPRTASYVAGDKSYGGKLGRYLLKDPKENLEIGQKYIQQLISQSAVSNDLFSLAIAYNAGPGNLRKWKNQYPDIDDPLLFVELIPVSETRSFVERVMRNLWIYRQRMNQDTPSLDSVASGSWARYVQLDSDLPFDVALSE
jgi:soluble lytic murein transglycosylase-like protein|tara:strand:- start:37704 stop:39671 length:1968 start_codon:yes stop_codon:yes gene_type:complete